MTAELPAYDPAYDDEAPPPQDEGPWLRPIAWWVATVFLGGFAIFEGVTNGVLTIIAALLFFALPDAATRFGGVGPGHRWYGAVHRVWIPLVIVIGYSLGPIVFPPIFTAGLAWLARIALDRALGRGYGAA
ncbi:hypothetical protein HNP84_006536 [Thermocatellispora tengchongensis]|uniref:DUF4260 family protein n=1 Tax=Thermocatellispora tengchongensis TaxID=1073253 RepID=A0A840PL57_9ACTN|nr:hypothetical protein [Thermocatellispora tengchongensis]MBB5136785.1 hypothetical protein [Thermocatellispora tengchongensis]